MPTVDTLFRTLIQEELPEIARLIEEQNRLAAEEEKKKQYITRMPMGDLPAPPRIETLKPLEIPRRKTEREINEALEQNLGKVKSMVRYDPIPIDKKLSRQEASQILTNSIAVATEEWKKWLVAALEYEHDQWSSRVQTLHRAREARDQDKIANEKYQKENEKNKNDKKKKK
jgi:hypothetical protein